LTRVLFDQTQRYFFDPKGRKLKNLVFFRGNFPNPNQRWLTQPEQEKIDPTYNLGQNIFSGPITTAMQAIFNPDWKKNNQCILSQGNSNLQ